MRLQISRQEGDLEGEQPGPRQQRGLGWLSPTILRLACLLLLFSLTVPGCSGCNQDPDAEKTEEEEEKEKPKDDFDSGAVEFLPSDATTSGTIKPGHWGVLKQSMRANNYDFVGQLYVAPANRSQQEMEIERTPYRLALRRPVSLPKGQAQQPSVTYFMPRPSEHDARNAYLRMELRTRGGGRTMREVSSPTGAIMPDHQYFMVVLAGRPDDYGYLAANFSRPPLPGVIGRNMNLYRVLRPNVSSRAPLPDHPLAWTGIAYLVMDDFDPSVLTPAQESAMIDWLHWGGQVVVSGPRSLDRLKSSALAPYLPAEGGSAVEFAESDFREINDYWALDPRAAGNTPNDRNRRSTQVEDVAQAGDPARVEENAANAETTLDSRRDSTETLLVKEGIELALHDDARWVPHTGQLVAERSVGRGRVVVTAFSLSNRAIASYWISRENFINGALMGLPGRRFEMNSNRENSFSWVGEESSFPLDPRVVCNLRYFSRDLGSPGGSVVMRSQNAVDSRRMDSFERGSIWSNGVRRGPESWTEFVDQESPNARRRSAIRPVDAPLVHEGWATAPHSGVAGWYDFSATANAARETLNEAAGIEVPSGDFVAKVLLGYIFVLVPVNWIFFRLIGRVELAWVAAPIIAILGMVVVVKVAQLDIGFARSRTEVGVLELQPGHDRGHLTRYVGLYTSLTTGFSLGAEVSRQPGDVPLLLPFSTDPKQGQLQQTRSTVQLDRDENIELNGMNVISASTGMVHIEQMLPLGGSLQLVGDELVGEQVFNGTTLSLHDVGILRRSPNGLTEIAWVGELEAGTTAQLEFAPMGDRVQGFPQWNASPTTSPSQGDGTISLRKLMDLAADPGRLRGGDTRLVGWYDEELGPIVVQPHTSQNIFRTMVVANLAYADLGEPARDENLPPALRDDDGWGFGVMDAMPTQAE